MLLNAWPEIEDMIKARPPIGISPTALNHLPAYLGFVINPTTDTL
jgi:hypothetical protein